MVPCVCGASRRTGRKNDHKYNSRIVETAADTFLNWVRGSFQDDDDGAAWEQFFDTYIGVFLRDAAIFNYPSGMVGYYLQRASIPVPVTRNKFSGTFTLGPPNLRQTAVSQVSENIIGNFDDNLSNPFNVYGLINEDPGDGADYWVLTNDIFVLAGEPRNRLVWMTSSSVDGAPGTLDPIYEDQGNEDFPRNSVAPGRPVDAIDLTILFGVVL